MGSYFLFREVPAFPGRHVFPQDTTWTLHGCFLHFYPAFTQCLWSCQCKKTKALHRADLNQVLIIRQHCPAHLSWENFSCWVCCSWALMSSFFSSSHCWFKCKSRISCSSALCVLIISDHSLVCWATISLTCREVTPALLEAADRAAPPAAEGDAKTSIKQVLKNTAKLWKMKLHKWSCFTDSKATEGTAGWM